MARIFTGLVVIAGAASGWPLVAADEPKPKAVLKGHTDEVYALAFSPDGKTLASAGQDASVRLWDPTTGRERAVLISRDRNSNKRFTFYALAFHPDGKTLASGGDENPIELWDPVAGKARATLKTERFHGQALAFSPDGKTLAEAGVRAEIRLRDAGTGEVKSVLQRSPDGPPKHRALAYSPDGRLLAAGNSHGVVELREAATGKLQASLRVGGDLDKIQSLAFRPDSAAIAVGADGQLQVWDPRTAKKTADLKGHDSFVFAVSFSPDGTTLASGGEDGTLRLWDVAAQTERARIRAGGDRDPAVYCLTFSPDGKTLATAGHDGKVRLWDAARLAGPGK